MIQSVPFSPLQRRLLRAYLSVFALFLLLPLTVVVIFSFNNSAFAALPWQGFSWQWYLGDTQPNIGLFNDSNLLSSVGHSALVAIGVTGVSVALGLSNAHLMTRFRFRGQQFLSIAMLLPLVIPGVILGVTILVASSQVANAVDQWFYWEWLWFRPGLVLVVVGQSAFITSISTLMLLARYKKFDISVEEAALNLGASPWQAFSSVTLPFLRPSIWSAAIVSFLMSFENFNTTLMLVGSDAPLTIEMYQRMRQGSTPVINAVSVCLMILSGGLALVYLWLSKAGEDKRR
ncbi:ABC transporter permease [Vibrio sp. WXL103]|uniref:ABC transporter permease n=1 Tax=unclassified Vibrio TaxID=2614977 RepID=UPI003EC4D286